MKKDGLFAEIVRALVAEEQKKYAKKTPNWFTDQKKQLWYLMMNQIDGSPDPEEEKNKTSEKS